MTENPILIETSFADAVAIITAAAELPEQTRRHWPTSMRQIAKIMDKPLEVIPARYSAIRADLSQLHHAPAGLTPKTLQNHKSNTKSALLWLAREKGVPEHGAPLTAAWETLRAGIKDRLVRSRLSSMMRYCSANNVPPTEVDEAVVDRFVVYRSRCGKPADDAFRRLFARAWNANVGILAGWPSRQLLVPAVKATVEIEWSEFSERLRQEIDQYLRGLTKVRRSRTGQRIRPLKASTIQTRRAELQAAARMAVKTGVPIDKLDSLSALLAPAVAEKVIDAYWQKNGDTPKLFTIDLACRFLAIAKEIKCLNDEQCDRLDEMRRDLEDRRQGGITDKNMAFIRQAITPKVWSRVTTLPLAMMAEARRQQHAPIKAAVTAQLAVAIAIESVAPIRLGNLTAIRLNTNLIKLNGADSNYWLTFPDYDVKNRVKLDFPLWENVTELINEYVHDFRPALLRGRNEDWLFPGQCQGPKGKTSFSGQIVARIYKATGLRMTVHQFRHAAGALILMQRPGEYELVRQLLGHRNVETTINFYLGLQGIQASEIFSKIVAAQMEDDGEEDE
jgi:hypothetical protein